MENETYEQRRLREQEEVKANNERLKKILVKMGFEPIKQDEDTFYNSYVRGKKENMEITLKANEYRNKGKLSLYGSYPKNKKGDYVYNPTELNFNEPNISLSKTDEQIIKDLEKRFFPYYKKKLDYIEERVKEQNKEIDNKENLIKILGDSLNIKPYKDSLSEYDYNKDIDNLKIDVVYNGKIDISFRTNKEFIFKIVDLIKSEEKKQDD
jgi:hypothetical protein